MFVNSSHLVCSLLYHHNHTVSVWVYSVICNCVLYNMICEEINSKLPHTGTTFNYRAYNMEAVWEQWIQGALKVHFLFLHNRNTIKLAVHSTPGECIFLSFWRQFCFQFDNVKDSPHSDQTIEAYRATLLKMKTLTIKHLINHLINDENRNETYIHRHILI